MKDFNASATQIRILNLVKEGLQDKDIKARLNLGVHVIKNNMYEMFRENNCKTRAQLVYKAAKANAI